MLLANKLKVKNLNQLSVPPKVYLNGILTYIEKDPNRMGELENLLESVNFKKINKEELQKIYKKKVKFIIYIEIFTKMPFFLKSTNFK